MHGACPSIVTSSKGQKIKFSVPLKNMSIIKATRNNYVIFVGTYVHHAEKYSERDGDNKILPSTR